MTAAKPPRLHSAQADTDHDTLPLPTVRPSGGARHNAARRAAASALCAVAGSVMAQGNIAAETSPYSAGAGLAVVHDDNIFRAPDAEAQADRYTVTRLFGDLDRGYGRQQLRGHAELRDHRYRERRELNHLAYGARLGWDGSTEGEVRWNLSHETARKLASYGTVVDPAFRGANVETIDQTLAGVQLGMQAQWVVNGALSHRRVEHTAQAFERERVRLDTVGASVQWNPLGPLSASVGPRTTRGRVPATSDGVERSFKRHDIDFGLRWSASGQSELRARLSLTRQQDDGSSNSNSNSDSDFSGATGQVDWQWIVSGKTRLNAALSRETGSETVFFAPTGATLNLPGSGSGDNRQLSTALRARLDHDLTGKIALGLEVQYAHRQLSAAGLLADGSVSDISGSDNSTLVRLALRWAPTRSTVVSCSVGHERRSSSTVLSAPYRANTAECQAQLTLRWS